MAHHGRSGESWQHHDGYSSSAPWPRILLALLHERARAAISGQAIPPGLRHRSLAVIPRAAYGLAVPLEFFSAACDPGFSQKAQRPRSRKPLGTFPLGLGRSCDSILLFFDDAGVLHNARLSGIRPASWRGAF